MSDQSTNTQYEVRIMGKVLLRGRTAALLFLLLVMFLPTGLILWPEGAPTRKKWIHRGRLLLLYSLAYLLYRILTHPT